MKKFWRTGIVAVIGCLGLLILASPVIGHADRLPVNDNLPIERPKLVASGSTIATDSYRLAPVSHGVITRAATIPLRWSAIKQATGATTTSWSRVLNRLGIVLLAALVATGATYALTDWRRWTPRVGR